MTVTYILFDGINPEPWTSPQLGTIRKGGKVVPTSSKNATLRVYQNAIAEALDTELKYVVGTTEKIELDVWFWRRLERYRSDAGRWITRHRADRSNLLKAFEDALQYDPKQPDRAYVFKNDVQIQGGRTTIVEQDINTEPRILIAVRSLESSFENEQLFGLRVDRRMRNKSQVIWTPTEIEANEV